jgi:hypothetical protein
MDALTAARIQTVRDHMRLECESDWDAVIATFAHPRYELYGAGTVFTDVAARLPTNCSGPLRARTLSSSLMSAGVTPT